MKTCRRKVLFVSCEDSRKVVQQRIARLCQAHGILPANLEGWLYVLDLSDSDPALFREQKSTSNGKHIVKTETLLLISLAEMVEQYEIGLVILDNASDMFDGNEIERAMVRSFIRSLRTHLARPDRAVLLLSHVNKASASYGSKAGTETYSGSTAWHNSVRSRITLASDGEKHMLITHDKANLGMKATPVRMAWSQGVPMVETAATPEKESLRDAADMDVLVEIVRDFDQRGERLTTSFQGSSTAYNLLKGEKSFPINTDSSRLMRLFRQLESDGRIFRKTVKDNSRRNREVFSCQPSECAQ